MHLNRIIKSTKSGTDVRSPTDIHLAGLKSVHVNSGLTLSIISLLFYSISNYIVLNYSNTTLH